MPVINKQRILDVVKNRYGDVIPVPADKFAAFQKDHEDLGSENARLKDERITLMAENENLKKLNAKKLDEATPLSRFMQKINA